MNFRKWFERHIIGTDPAPEPTAPTLKVIYTCSRCGKDIKRPVREFSLVDESCEGPHENDVSNLDTVCFPFLVTIRCPNCHRLAAQFVPVQIAERLIDQGVQVVPSPSAAAEAALHTPFDQEAT